MTKFTYRVVGNETFAVVEVVGKRTGVVYDLLETRKEADDICAVLNRGIGPEWDAVEPALADY